MKSGAVCTPKVTKRQKSLIKLQQVWDDTLSLTDLVRFDLTDLNLIISHLSKASTRFAIFSSDSQCHLGYVSIYLGSI